MGKKGRGREEKGCFPMFATALILRIIQTTLKYQVNYGMAVTEQFLVFFVLKISYSGSPV